MQLSQTDVDVCLQLSSFQLLLYVTVFYRCVFVCGEGLLTHVMNGAFNLSFLPDG